MSRTARLLREAYARLRDTEDLVAGAECLNDIGCALGMPHPAVIDDYSSSRLLTIFRGELRRLQAEGTPGQAVWLTPTARSRRAVRRELLAGSLGVCFAPNVFTFDAFAERLLQTTGPGITPLSRVAQRMIVRTIIDEGVSQNSLEYFAPIADTSGFLDLVLDDAVDEPSPEEVKDPDHCHPKQGKEQRSSDSVPAYDRGEKQHGEYGGTDNGYQDKFVFQVTHCPSLRRLQA